MLTGRDRRDFARHLRNNPTGAERALWNILSQIRPRFTRQLRIDPFVGDFACRRARLIIVADGSQHVDSMADKIRTHLIERESWLVIRFWKTEILTNIEGVADAIVTAMEPRLPPGEVVEFVGSRSGRERRPRTRTQGKKSHP